MDPVWKTLPDELTDKICNMLTKVRKIDENLKNDIVNQWYLFDKYKYHCISFFGVDGADFVMYDDLKNIMGVEDDFPEEMDITQVIDHMWMRLDNDQRKYLVYA